MSGVGLRRYFWNNILKSSLEKEKLWIDVEV